MLQSPAKPRLTAGARCRSADSGCACAIRSVIRSPRYVIPPRRYWAATGAGTGSPVIVQVTQQLPFAKRPRACFAGPHIAIPCQARNPAATTIVTQHPFVAVRCYEEGRTPAGTRRLPVRQRRARHRHRRVRGPRCPPGKRHIAWRRLASAHDAHQQPAQRAKRNSRSFDSSDSLQAPARYLHPEALGHRRCLSRAAGGANSPAGLAGSALHMDHRQGRSKASWSRSGNRVYHLRQAPRVPRSEALSHLGARAALRSAAAHAARAARELPEQLCTRAGQARFRSRSGRASCSGYSLRIALRRANANT